MTDAKRFLQQIRILDIRIDTKLNELEQLKDIVTKVTPTLTGMAVSGSRSQDKIGDAVIKMVALQDEIKESIDAFVIAKRNVSSVLDSIQNADQLQVLHKRYVQYKKLETIAMELGMTVRNITYIHGAALNTVEEILKNKESENN